jgi:hemerythrin-like domain-containing protein
MEHALAQNAVDDFALYVNRYSRLLTEHIDKEDYILFPKALDILTAGDDVAMLKRFDDIENEMGKGTHERFHRMLEELGARYLSKPAQAA